MSFEGIFKLELFRDGKEFLTQHYDTMPDSKIRLSVDELPWLVIGKHSDDHWYTAAAFLSDYAAECYVKDFRAVGIGDYKVINRSDINDKYKVL